MIPGVSTACLYPMETREAFAFLASQGVGCIEVFLNAPHELSPEYLEQLNRLRRRYGVLVPAVHPFTSPLEPLLFFSAYPGRLEDGLAWYDAYLYAARELGAGILVLHGDSLQNPFPVEESYRNLQKFACFCQDRGVRLAHENVSRCKSRDPAYLEGIRRCCPEMGFVLDIKQAVRSQANPMDFVEALGEGIVHLHLSDNAPGQSCLPIGRGTCDLSGLLRAAKAKGFDGAVILELYRDNYDSPQELLTSYHRLSQLLLGL